MPDVDSTPAPRRHRRWFRLTGTVLINTILVAIIAGLLVATWLPAYVYHHPDTPARRGLLPPGFGESQGK
jgi:hypothetical protein